MTRKALLLALALVSLAGLTACGDHRLTATGFARIDTGGTIRSFELPADIRLDGEASPNGVTGSCQVRELPDVDGIEQGGVVVDLFRGAGGDNDLRSITIMARTDHANDSISATIGTTTFQSTATCAIAVTAGTGGDVTLDTTGCVIDDGAGSDGTADVHLELHGCSVASDD